MSFEDAVKDAAPPLSTVFQPGKQALKGEHRQRVRCRVPSRITGSIDVDAALADAQPQASRWDYGIGYRPPHGDERALWVEVHPAATSDVDTVLRKLAWLKAYLRESAPALDALTVADAGSKPFVWLATGRVRITPNSRHARLLRQSGLDLPRQVLDLP